MIVDSLHRLFIYIPETGELVWRVSRKGRGCIAGRIAGTISRRRDTSYRAVMLFGKKLYAHRIIWEMHYGQIADGMCIDHIDGDGLNNRLDNLRLATLSDNQRNARMPRNNASGAVGVNSTKSGYQVHIAGKYVGHFKDFGSACNARKSAESEFGFHENHGRVIK